MIPRIVVLLMYSALLFYPFFAEAQQKAKYNRQANSIVCDNVRFQFLTPSLGRVEYSPSGTFVDAPTAVVMKRKWPEVKVTVREKGGVLSARTAMVTLQYIISPGKLTQENLRLRWNDPNGEHSWSPGDSDNANLGGITYSLDGARKGRLQTTNQGLLSKNGYFILDDSHTPLWDSVAGWISPRREQDGQDFYWCVYGDNYPHALQEYARLCGSIPMIPRYVLGTWITDLNYEYLENSEVVAPTNTQTIVSEASSRSSGPTGFLWTFWSLILGGTGSGGREVMTGAPFSLILRASLTGHGQAA